MTTDNICMYASLIEAVAYGLLCGPAHDSRLGRHFVMVECLSVCILWAQYLLVVSITKNHSAGWRLAMTMTILMHLLNIY